MSVLVQWPDAAVWHEVSGSRTLCGQTPPAGAREMSDVAGGLAAVVLFTSKHVGCTVCCKVLESRTRQQFGERPLRAGRFGRAG